ncbi:MAG: type II CAAX prenyl endopeptidase Rce1 family protein, partial [Reyranellales bacterium]
MPRPPANQRTATAIAAIVIVAIAFAANALFNHTAKGAGVKAIPGFYPVVFFIGLGTLVPAWLLGKIALGGHVTPRQLGIGADRRDAVAIVAALVLGGAFAAVPLAPLLRDPAGLRLLHSLFAQLLVASTAEVLLFLGVLGAGIDALLGRDGDWLTRLVIIAVSSVAFGLFHFTYPEPWDTPALAAMLGLIWAATSLLFVVSRSLLAAIVFDNVMAVVGFARNALT